GTSCSTRASSVSSTTSRPCTAAGPSRPATTARTAGSSGSTSLATCGAPGAPGSRPKRGSCPEPTPQAIHLIYEVRPARGGFRPLVVNRRDWKSANQVSTGSRLCWPCCRSAHSISVRQESLAASLSLPGDRILDAGDGSGCSKLLQSGGHSFAG